MKRFHSKQLYPFLKHCQWCTEPFVTKRKHGIYCSEKCRKNAYLLRRAEKLMRPKESKPGVIQRILNFFRS